MRLALSSVPKDLLPSTRVYVLARICTGIILFWAGGVRLMDMGAFIRILSSYSSLPDAVIFSVAIGLPVAQLIAGVGLVLDLRGSVKASLCVLLLSVAVLASGILCHLNLDGSLFPAEPTAPQKGLPRALLIDAGLLVVMLYLSRCERARRQTWRWQ